jgi:hypothetical protein
MQLTGIDTTTSLECDHLNLQRIGTKKSPLTIDREEPFCSTSYERVYQSKSKICRILGRKFLMPRRLLSP